MHFDNAFDPGGTTVRVLNGNGDIVSETGKPDAADQTLSVPLKALAPGQYFVTWRALSKDGDHTMGAYSFTVTGAAH